VILRIVVFAFDKTVIIRYGRLMTDLKMLVNSTSGKAVGCLLCNPQTLGQFEVEESLFLDNGYEYTREGHLMMRTTPTPDVVVIWLHCNPPVDAVNRACDGRRDDSHPAEGRVCPGTKISCGIAVTHALKSQQSILGHSAFLLQSRQLPGLCSRSCALHSMLWHCRR
jgi:hypothetical protein